MVRILAQRVFAHLFLAQVVALLGTGLATIGLSLLAYSIVPDRAGQVLGTALAIKMVASAFFSPVITTVVDRFDRRHVMIATHVIRVGVACLLPFVTQVWQIYLLVFFLQCSTAAYTPTFQATIPDILTDEDDYTAALSLTCLAGDLEQVISPAIAAILLVFVSSGQLFFGTAVGFVAAAVLVASVAIPPHTSAPTRAPFVKRMGAGAVTIFHTPSLRPILVLNLVAACAGSFVLVQTVVLVEGHWLLSEQAVTLMLGINGAGSMILALSLGAVLARISEKLLMLGGAAVLSACCVLIAVSVNLPAGRAAFVFTGLVWLVIGVGWAAVEVPVGRILKRSVANEDLPAVFVAQFSFQHMCWLVCYPLTGWLGDVSLTLAAVVLAVISTVATAFGWVLWPRHVAFDLESSKDRGHDHQEVTCA